MSDIIDLGAKRAEKQPHMAGSARCMNCGHTWAAVAPIGTRRLECSACHTEQGAWVGAILPQEGVEFMVCDCGNDLWIARRDCLQCAACGLGAER